MLGSYFNYFGAWWVCRYNFIIIFYCWPTRPRQNRWSLVFYMVSVRSSQIQQYRDTTQRQCLVGFYRLIERWSLFPRISSILSSTKQKRYSKLRMGPGGFLMFYFFNILSTPLVIITFSQVFLDELWSDHADKRCRCVMSHGFGQHGLAASWWAVHEHTPWWVNSNLLVEVEVGQGQLYGFFHLLLLHVHASNVRIGNVGLLVRLKEKNCIFFGTLQWAVLPYIKDWLRYAKQKSK